MKELFTHFLGKIDAEDLLRRTETLCQLEAPQTYQAYQMVADHLCQQMKQYRFKNIELFQYPADGKTEFEDKIMPLAWDVNHAKLTLCDVTHTVAADYEAEPLSLIQGSTATAPCGEIVGILTQQQLLTGEDPHNALVMLEPEVRPAHPYLKHILDLGARGIITDHLVGRYKSPDCVEWCNGCTEGNHWHVIEGDRDFIGFSVSPRMGNKIRSLAGSTELKARIECDARRHTGVIPAVTALLPGRRKEEFWVIAHAFEPFLDDDSAGVTAGIELMRLLSQLGSLEYSLRIIFTMELYGFAAFHANFSGRVIGACNLDALSCMKNSYCAIYPPVPGKTFQGIGLLNRLCEELKEVVHLQLYKPECFDDMVLCDSTIQIPTVWFESKMESGNIGFWHNSCQRDHELIDAKQFARTTALAATWVYSVAANVSESVGTHSACMPEVAAPAGPWRKYAEEQFYSRSSVGLPHDLARVPRNLRRKLPDDVLYGPFGTLLTRLDSKKNVAQAIQETESIREAVIPDAQIKKYMDALNYLTEWGYLKAEKRTTLRQEDLCNALFECGVERGDLLLVHASISRYGYVEGGAVTLIQAIREVIGPEGTMLCTTFTQPYIMLGGVLNRIWRYRPFDSGELSQIWTGITGRTLLEQFPDALRSAHITHSWAGIGPLASVCLVPHGEADEPTGWNSPLGEALRRGGKVLFAGSGLAPNTFLHYIETEHDVPYLGQAVCKVREKDGSQRIVTIKKHLPGHRCFYRADAENCKFYQKAFKAGLQIRESKIGLAKMQMIPLQHLWEIGSALLKKHPDIFLCDDPDCIFCRESKRKFGIIE